MARNIDIGGYFGKLAKIGRGGRRLDHGRDGSADDAAAGHVDDVRDEQVDGEPENEPGRSAESGRSRGGLGGRLKDALGRGTTTAKRTAGTVRGTATKRLPKRLSKRRKARREDLPHEGVVTIEYSPSRDGDPDPGEVVWAWVPFEEDPSQGKDRPVVIIGRREDSLVGIPLTTRPNDREAQLKIGTGGWDPKRRTSYARIWRMLDVDPGTARREGAVLDVPRFEQLVQTVDRYYDIRLPPAESGSGDADWDY